MTAVIHGPRGGYNFAEKMIFRSWCWDHIGGRHCGTGEVFTGDVLLMPSLEGLEIEEALKRGFLPSQLHVCDLNPAVVATLQRRFPGINTYGIPVERACQLIAAKGVKLIAANLDFCGKLARPVLSCLYDCWRSRALDNAIVLVTVLRGREEVFLRDISPPPEGLQGVLTAFASKWWIANNGIDKPTAGDVWRVWRAYLATGQSRGWVYARPYTSTNGQSLLTIVYPQPRNCRPFSAWQMSEWEPSNTTTVESVESVGYGNGGL